MTHTESVPPLADRSFDETELDEAALDEEMLHDAAFEDAELSSSELCDPALDDFIAELRAIGTDLRRAAGAGDIDHLQKIERKGRIASALGYATAWLAPNPVSAAAIAAGTTTQWLMMHHISHKGYDRVPGIPAKYTSKVFARGRRRWLDWADWITPSAWHLEHDHAHHYHLGEDGDPDLLERNTQPLINARLPRWSKRAVLGGFAGIWKWAYYAPSTIGVERQKRQRLPVADAPTSLEMLNPGTERGRETWRRSLLPNLAIRFALVPVCFLPLGPKAVRNVALNVLIADIISNIHGFIVITPSHTASDLYRFEEPADAPGEFALRQIIGSANYTTGGDINDHLHMWLNYQIEHHLWPDLTMLQYQSAQPRLAELCEKYAVPYLQESVWTRVAKTFRILDGSEQMLTAKQARHVLAM
ncbi:MAG: fatty acid desaturase [Acidimicrobiales bacterium]